MLWGYSLSAGHVVKIAADDQRIAAVFLLCPFLDRFARIRRSPLRNTAWIAIRAVGDLIGRSTTIPVTASLRKRSLRA